MKISISQSLIKDWWGYKEEKFCGLMFEAVHIFKTNEIKQTEPMKIGSRFEYECIGSLNMDGLIPELALTQSGKPVAKMKYALAQVNAFAEALKRYNVTEVKINQELKYDCGEYYILAHPDMKCKKDGELCFIDIKTTSMLGSKSAKYEDYGFDVETLPSKKKLTIQAIHYKYAAIETLHVENIPFYWWIYSTTGSGDALFIEAVLSKETLAAHINVMDEIYSEITDEMSIGLKPFPSVKLCRDCPLFDSCKSRTIVPEINKVVIG
jgi:hypothetical protein